MGHLGVQEPFANLFTQGMITRDGAKMSKSKGNTVSPVEYVERYGADTTRTYICFMGPPERGGDWTDEGVEGVFRFLSRLWRLGQEVERERPSGDRPRSPGRRARSVGKAHWAIDKVTPRHRARLPVPHRDRGGDGAGQRRLPAQGRRSTATPTGEAALRFATATAASLIFPFAPHLGAEVYEALEGGRVWEEPWPEADPALLESDTFTLVVQVNGKRRDQIEAAVGRPARTSCSSCARASEHVQRHLDGREIVKEIVVPGKLVNLVVQVSSTLFTGSSHRSPARVCYKRRVLVRRFGEAATIEVHRLRSHILMDAGELGSRNLSVNWIEVPPGASEELRSHEEAEQVYVVVRGTGTMSATGDTQELAPGDLVLIPPATDHAVANDGARAARARLRPVARASPPTSSSASAWPARRSATTATTTTSSRRPRPRRCAAAGASSTAGCRASSSATRCGGGPSRAASRAGSRNRGDGAVEAVFEGAPRPTSRRWSASAARGPRGAEVERVEVRDGAARGPGRLQDRVTVRRESARLGARDPRAVRAPCAACPS